MAAVKRGPLGVWFSLALAILALSVLLGWMAATKAVVWHYRRQQSAAALRGDERSRLESMMSDLAALQYLEVVSGFVSNHDEIAGLEALRQRPHSPEAASVIELQLGLAYVRAGVAAEQNNNRALAGQYLRSAQPLFQSLGWRDSSEEALKTVAKRQMQRWSPSRQTKEPRK